MMFARWVYAIAGVYGVLIIPPLYFLEKQIGLSNPPPITHPEYFYGFVGITLAWQLAFLAIAKEPLRYRPIMLCTIAEKVLYGVAVLLLFLHQRVAGAILGFGAIDLTFAVLFLRAFLTTRTIA